MKLSIRSHSAAPRPNSSTRPHPLQSCVIAALLAVAAHSPVHAGPPPGTGNWTQIVNDNFDQTDLDPTRWRKGMRWADALNKELQAYRPENITMNGDKCIISVNMKRAQVNNAAGYPVGATVLNIDGYNAAIPNGARVRIGTRIPGASEDCLYTVASSVGGTTPTQITLTTPLRYAVADNTRVVLTAALSSVGGYEWGNFDYRSGAFQSYDRWAHTYGYYEARVKMSGKKGTWPAFWLLPDRGPSSPNVYARTSVGDTWATPDGPDADTLPDATGTCPMGNEIDIFEYMGTWKDPATGLSSSHSGYFWGYDPYESNSEYTLHKQLPQPDNEFHTYGVYWAPGVLRYYVDGRAVWSNYDPANVAVCPHYVIFNVAVHTDDWKFGVTQDQIDADLPGSMEIDYFRVWTGTGGVSPTTGDIGTVATPGSHSFNSGLTTVTGNGAGIGGNADAFHYVPQEFKGNGTILVKLNSLANPNAAAKAGIMFRESIDDPGSKNVFIGKNPAGTPYFQFRSTAAQGTTSTAGATTSGTWLRLVRNGDTFTGSVSSDGVTWAQIGTQNVAMKETIFVGLAATSNTTTTSTATAVFEAFKVTPSLIPQDLCDDWLSPGVAGSTTVSGNVYTVKGSGLWFGDTSDTGHFASQQMVGDWMITAKVATLTGGSQWQAVAGIMVRDYTAWDYRNVFVGRNSQYCRFHVRSVKGQTTTGSSYTRQPWVRLTRVGNVFTGYSSPDGITWTQLNTQTVNMPETLYVGLGVSAKDTTALCTATFENVSYNDWPSIPQTATYEAESIVDAQSSDPLTVTTDSYASGGAVEGLAANAVGDYATYVIPVAQPGTYAVKFRFKRHTSRGQYQLSIDGVNQGSVQDQYGASSYVEVNLGPKVFTSAGNKAFTFTVTGKNAATGSSYVLSFDYIKLVPQ